MHGIRTVQPQALRRALRDAGIPDDFAVVCAHQTVPRAVIREIDAFIEVFDRVTTRPSWQRAMIADAPECARDLRPEACFFSAWDVHLPPGAPERWRLIEVNDNGSGFVFASIIDRTYHALSGLAGVEPPPADAAFGDHLLACIDREERAVLGGRGEGACFILDDADSLAHGHFRVEHELLAAMLRARGREVAVGAPGDLSARDGALEHAGRDVSCVIDRSTDFLWQADAFAPLRRSFAERSAYIAPNPFTYLTRSDKRLLEPLSLGDRDAELGITRDERAILGERVPETHVLREDNIDELVRRKHDLFFKPAHGYASHGTISGDDVGRSRLRRLLRDGELYVAQQFVPKGRLEVPGVGALATDLRVWAYRGARYLISGRATRGEARRDLREGGWLPTFAEA